MSNYTFAFKQNDIHLEFFTSDQDFINKEMEKWIFAISQKKTFNPAEKISSSEIKNEHKSNHNTEENFSENSNFSEILNKQIVTMPDENCNVTKKTEIKSSVKEFVKSKSPQSLLDYLICAAYYLSENQLLERFSLKQLNSQIVQMAKKPVDHSIVQQAVSGKYIKVVPDYTGMADFTEYSITTEGEQFFCNEL